MCSTGAVILAGFISAIKAVGLPLKDHRLVFFGAGSAGIGVADAILELYAEEGISAEDGKKHFWFVDSKGLVTTTRGDELQDHKKPWARSMVFLSLVILLFFLITVTRGL